MSSAAVALTSRSPALKPVNQAVAPSNQQRPAPASVKAPSTPKAQVPIVSNQPGTWRHPQIDDIARRQNRSVFNSENFRSASKHAFFFLVALLTPAFAQTFFPRWVWTIIGSHHPNIVLAIRIFFFCNFLYAFRPLIVAKDEIEDVPLTPSQRALLGLKPSGTPITPGSQFITPPRYSRSGTPRSIQSDRARSQSPYSASPLDGRTRSGSFGSTDRGVGQTGRGISGGSFSGSPLVQKALTGSTGRRLSFDAASGSSSSGLPSTPTPVGGGRASVGLNSKWLYERA
ncbi:hypothetical protein ANO11243_018640 [Dothideomycetidae sp. 11243]|nr:hypothetical protein ANO11243_018640 [fungal sp. No.11243]